MKKILLALISAPFFIAGFLWSFAKHGWKDGVALETGLRKFYEVY